MQQLAQIYFKALLILFLVQSVVTKIYKFTEIKSKSCLMGSENLISLRLSISISISISQSSKIIYFGLHFHSIFLHGQGREDLL